MLRETTDPGLCARAFKRFALGAVAALALAACGGGGGAVRPAPAPAPAPEPMPAPPPPPAPSAMFPSDVVSPELRGAFTLPPPVVREDWSGQWREAWVESVTYPVPEPGGFEGEDRRLRQFNYSMGIDRIPLSVVRASKADMRKMFALSE